MRSIILFFVMLAVSIASSDDCKDTKCPAPPKHYEEFGCTPVKEAGKCCPSRYDCSSLENRDKNVCHYNKKTIEVGKQLNKENIEAPCTNGCYCRASGDDNSVASLECSHIDCPEFFRRPNNPPGETCINQYEKNKCCLSKTVCEDLNKLEKCEHDGKSYYEGQRIDTGRDCYSCICGKGWEDKPVEENKHCHKVNCHMELHSYKRIIEGCIPVYFKTDDCCPIDWRCPDTKTIVVPDSSRKVSDESSDLQCSFGKLKMSLGDNLSPDNDSDKCTLCSCKVPPHPHCIKTC